MTAARRSRRAPAALLLATGLLAAGCGTSSAASDASSGHDHGAPASVSAVAGAGKYDGINLPTPYHRPSFTLTGTDGAAYDFATATKGKPTLLYFGYTNCPDVCPTTMADISVALRDVDKSIAQRVQVVFVTTDPVRDTTARLAQWLGNFDADLPAPFIGLTGQQAVLNQAQLSAGVPLAEEDGQQHSSLVLLYGADDKAHVAFDVGNTPKDLAHDLELVAAGS